MAVITNYEKTVLVLLDRDGVVCANRKHGVLSYSEFRPVPGLRNSLKKFSGARFRVGIITNQPYLSEGLLSAYDRDRINKHLSDTAIRSGIERSHFTIKVCPHARLAGCRCRKPNIGLVEQVVKHFRLDTRRLRLYIVGDTPRDMETADNYYKRVLAHRGVSRNCVTRVLIKWRYGDNKADAELVKHGHGQDFVVRSLDSAARLILKLERER